jgi:hypothetical protein
MTPFQVCPCSTALICAQSTTVFLLSTFKFILYHLASPRSGILYLELEASTRRVRIQGEDVTVMTVTPPSLASSHICFEKLQ